MNNQHDIIKHTTLSSRPKMYAEVASNDKDMIDIENVKIRNKNVTILENILLFFFHREHLLDFSDGFSRQ